MLRVMGHSLIVICHFRGGFMGVIYRIFTVFLAGICVGVPLARGMGLNFSNMAMLCAGISLSLTILVVFGRDNDI